MTNLDLRIITRGVGGEEMIPEDSYFLAEKIWYDDLIDSHAFWLEYHPDKWEVFGLIWEWATKQEWWGTFLFFSRVNMNDILESEGAEPVSHSCVGLVHPVRFPQLIVDFLLEREGK